MLLALNEYYAYDFSELLGLDVRDSGNFGGERLDRHFTDPPCDPFLIRVDGKLAGFAIHEARRGLGTRAAFALFDRFTGPWEVRQVTANVAATTFWRKALASYTGGNFEEVVWNDAAFNGVVQRFVSPGQ